MTDSKALERAILEDLFESVCALPSVDYSIADSPLVRRTSAKLKIALRGSERCHCIRRSYGGPCESCQASDRELFDLRYFYNMVRLPKRHSLSVEDFVERIESYRKKVSDSNS